MHCVFADRCIVRSFSPLRTVAGGSILYPLDSAPRRSKISPEMQKKLLALPDTDDAGRIAVQLELAGLLGVSLAELSLLTDIAPKSLEKQLQAMSGRGLVFCWDKEAKSWISASALEGLSFNALDAVEAFHKKNPLQAGMAKGVVLAGMGRNVPPKLAHYVLEKLLKGGKLAADGETLRLPGHKVSLANDQQALCDALLKAHKESPLVPPNHTELFAALGITPKQAQPMFKLLAADGSLVKIKEDLYFLGEVMEELRAKVRAWFEDHEEISPGDFRDITTISRKNGVALLEHFDKEQITMRVGDKRVLRGRRP